MRKKLLIMDPLSPDGHYDINKVILDIASGEYDLFYAASQKFTESIGKNVNCYGIDNGLFKIKKNSLDNRRRLYNVCLFMMKYAEKIKPDRILVLSFDSIVMPITLMVNYKWGKKWNNVTRYMCHSNVDELEVSGLKRFLFSYFMKQCNFLVYEEYVNRFFRGKYHIRSNTFHHTINSYKKSYNKDMVNNSIKKFFDNNSIKVISSSSNGVEENLIEELIWLDQSGYLKDKDIKFFIKYKKKKYKSDNLWLYREYLSDDEYSYIFEFTHYVSLLYNVESYKYRISGVYFDAITFEKPLIYLPIMFFEDQVKRFGDIGIKIESTMKYALDECTNGKYKKYQKTIVNIRNRYSDQTILQELKELM